MCDLLEMNIHRVHLNHNCSPVNSGVPVTMYTFSVPASGRDTLSLVNVHLSSVAGGQVTAQWRSSIRYVLFNFYKTKALNYITGYTVPDGILLRTQ